MMRNKVRFRNNRNSRIQPSVSGCPLRHLRPGSQLPLGFGELGNLLMIEAAAAYLPPIGALQRHCAHEAPSRAPLFEDSDHDFATILLAVDSLEGFVGWKPVHGVPPMPCEHDVCFSTLQGSPHLRQRWMHGHRCFGEMSALAGPVGDENNVTMRQALCLILALRLGRIGGRRLPEFQTGRMRMVH